MLLGWSAGQFKGTAVWSKAGIALGSGLESLLRVSRCGKGHTVLELGCRYPWMSPSLNSMTWSGPGLPVWLITALVKADPYH